MKPEDTDLTSYLSFELEREAFGVKVKKVIEILEVPHITKVPKSPPFMRGVINLRGTFLPVIDGRLKFGFNPVTDSVNTCIIVFNIQMEGESTMVGALVDAVQEVFEMDDSQLLPPPGLGGNSRNEFIRGMATKEEGFILILEVDKIFSNDDILHLNKQLQEVKA